MICDLFTIEAMKYAVKHKIPYIINAAGSYYTFEGMFSRPTFQKSFGIGGLTILYPPIITVELLIGFQEILPYLNDTKLLINSAIGL